MRGTAVLLRITMNSRTTVRVYALMLVGALVVAGPVVASGVPETEQSAQGPRVVATTTIIGDVVAAVAGPAVTVETLIPLGGNPHSFRPTPSTLAALERADVVFANGLNLETGLIGDIERIATGRVVMLAEDGHDDEDHDEADHHDEDDHDDGDHVGEDHHDEDDHHDGEDHHDEDDHHDGEDHHHDHDHGGVDPHVWMDPMNVYAWVDRIEEVLIEAHPSDAAGIRARAAAYRAELEELDAEIRTAVASIPTDRRVLVTDHGVFGAFGERYGFEEIGTLVPGTDDQAEPSAQAIAALVRTIDEADVGAIFVGRTASDGLQNLAQAVASEAGRPVVIVPTLTGSLAPAGERGDSYIDYVRFNVEQIVSALDG